MFKVCTPELLWHGGGNENGKPDPVYAVDIHPSSILATAGIDASVPPKGSVRLWKINSLQDGQEFIADLCDHQNAVNVTRFSPCGKFLAAASDRQIIIYTVTNGQSWEFAGDSRNLERIWMRPSLDEICDLQWSPDSLYIIACSIDCKAEILRISSRDSLLLPGHSSYVQGVAWDPFNRMVVTQSADRSVKIHVLKVKSGMMLKLAPRGHVQLKMYDSSKSSSAIDGASSQHAETKELTAADFEPSNQKSKNLYADSTVPCFFRRPAFSPDGSLLVTPTGLYRPTAPSTQLGDGERLSSGHTNAKARQEPQTFCTHVFCRDHTGMFPNHPSLSLVGLEDPTVAVRFSPVLYSPVTAQCNENTVIPGAYRFVFAVVSISAVYVYDTQHAHPIVRAGGLHLACINDAAWTPDGRMLVVCSSDGYISFLRFDDGSLGEPMPAKDVPESVKRTYPVIYNYVAPIVEPVAALVSTENVSAKANTASFSTGNGDHEVAQVNPTESGKKRARITPVLVSTSPMPASPAFAIAKTAVPSGGNDVTVPSLIPVAASSSVDTLSSAAITALKGADDVSEAVLAKKPKKRITPTFVGLDAAAAASVVVDSRGETNSEPPPSTIAKT